MAFFGPPPPIGRLAFPGPKTDRLRNSRKAWPLGDRFPPLRCRMAIRLTMIGHYPHRNFSLAILFLSLFLSSGVLHCQEAVSPANETASDPAPGQNSGTGSPPQRDVSLRQLPKNFFSDQRDLWLFPGKLAQGHYWLPTVSIVGATAGLLAADPHDVSHFRRTSSFNGFNKAFSGKITSAEIGIVPLSFYVFGLARHDSYSEKTGLFAAEAVVDSMVLYAALNAVTRRLRPSDIAPSGPFTDTFFRARNGIIGHSFPSGHTIAAFSVATVVATRYRNHRWVPWVAYGIAGVIGFSRVTLQSHFPADVFVGAALGYTIARFDVLRAH
jgi:membrane-associated phospholipid phosphatase